MTNRFPTTNYRSRLHGLENEKTAQRNVLSLVVVSQHDQIK